MSQAANPFEETTQGTSSEKIRINIAQIENNISPH